MEAPARTLLPARRGQPGTGHPPARDSLSDMTEVTNVVSKISRRLPVGRRPGRQPGGRCLSRGQGPDHGGHDPHGPNRMAVKLGQEKRFSLREGTGFYPSHRGHRLLSPLQGRHRPDGRDGLHRVSAPPSPGGGSTPGGRAGSPNPEGASPSTGALFEECRETRHLRPW